VDLCCGRGSVGLSPLAALKPRTRPEPPFVDSSVKEYGRLPEFRYRAGICPLMSLYCGCGGRGFGSGTHGLQRRTFMPPFRSAKSDVALVTWVLLFGSECDIDAADGPATAGGGCTINWYGIVMRWGEQALQTTRPHLLLTMLDPKPARRYRLGERGRYDSRRTCNDASAQRS
jgi:hypothetical protein